MDGRRCRLPLFGRLFHGWFDRNGLLRLLSVAGAEHCLAGPWRVDLKSSIIVQEPVVSVSFHDFQSDYAMSAWHVARSGDGT